MITKNGNEIGASQGRGKSLAEELQSLKDWWERVQNNKPYVDESTFEKKSKEIQDKVMALYRKDSSIINKKDLLYFRIIIKKTLEPKLIKAIHSLLGDHHLREEKESIVHQFSAGRTTHVSDLRKSEALELIGHLKSLDEKERSATKMRNKVLSLAHEMNWRKQGTDEIDMSHVNNWCIAKSYLKKKLDDYTYAELPKLVSQFEEVYKSYLKGV